MEEDRFRPLPEDDGVLVLVLVAPTVGAGEGPEAEAAFLFVLERMAKAVYEHTLISFKFLIDHVFIYLSVKLLKTVD